MLYSAALRRARDHEQADLIEAVNMGMAGGSDVGKIIDALRGRASG